jgi:hypothetical protein
MCVCCFVFVCRAARQTKSCCRFAILSQSHNKTTTLTNSHPHTTHHKQGAHGITSYPFENQISLLHESSRASSSSSAADDANTFTFDSIYDERSTQTSVYDNSVSPLVESFVDGYNATVLAYGQTGSGKTFTMGTDGTEGGIVPRVVERIFRDDDDDDDDGENDDTNDEANDENANSENTAAAAAVEAGDVVTHSVAVHVSFIEIYNEDIHDLLRNRWVWRPLAHNARCAPTYRYVHVTLCIILHHYLLASAYNTCLKYLLIILAYNTCL